jgi:hypothetical protein
VTNGTAAAAAPIENHKRLRPVQMNFAVTRGAHRVTFIMEPIRASHLGEVNAMKHVRTPDLKAATKPEGRRSKTLQDQIVALSTNLNLVVVIIFGAIGCLIAVDLMLRHPDLWPTVDQFNPLVGP